MSTSARGPVEYPLHTLTPQRFEILSFLLAHAEDPAVVPVRDKDRGLDARLPDGRGRTLRGWQAKRFADGAIHWQQCQRSVEQAVAFWRPPYITFTFAHDLSAAEQTKFKEELIDPFPLIRLDFWSGSEMQRRMRDSEDGRRAAHWLFENPDADLEMLRRALATGGELASTMQAAERQAVIQRFMDRDPHLHYTMISRNPQAPETPPAPASLLSVTLDLGGQEVRLDASEKYPGALEDLGGGPFVTFSADNAGEEAARAVRRIAESGEPETIGSGMGITMPEIPIGLRGLLPEEGIWAPAEVSVIPDSAPTRTASQGLTAIVSVGNDELALTLQHAEEPVDGFDGTLVGAAGGIEIFQSVRQSEGGLESRLDWRHTLGRGTALEQLIAARITLGVLRGDPLQLLAPSDRHVLASGQGAIGDIGDPESLEEHIQFLEFVAEVEAWLGAPLDPPARPSEGDVGELGRLLGLIRQPQHHGTWDQVRVTTHPGIQVPEGIVEAAVLRPTYAQLFGQKIYAGIEIILLHRARAERQPGTEVLLLPADPERAVTTTLQHPSLAPAEAAQTNMGEGEHRVLFRRPEATPEPPAP